MVRLRLSDVIRTDSTPEISIPHGTIKTWIPSKVERDCWKISIPHGTIKTFLPQQQRMELALFQFHMVRLRRTEMSYDMDMCEFQFHMVRLRPRCSVLFHQWRSFQFHMVRLRLRAFTEYSISSSFQFHMVRLRQQYGLPFVGFNQDFNSTWYD